MRKKLLGLFGLGVACVACCLPLVAGWLAAAGFGSVLAASISGISVDTILCVWLPVILISALVGIFLAARRRKIASCDCKVSCRV